MINEVTVRLNYTLNNKAKEGNIKLNFNDNLENAFNKYKNIKSLKNNQKEIEFYLKKENEKFLLDKKVEIKELNLKDGDLIMVVFKSNISNLENTRSHFNPNGSTGNLNIEVNSSSNISNIEKPLKKRNYFLLIILISIAIIITGVIVFIIIHLINKKKTNKKIVEEPKDSSSDNTNNNDNDNNNNNNGDDEGKDGPINSPQEKVYYKEELVTKKKPYYPDNMLFLYKTDKTMNIEFEGEMETGGIDLNMTNVKEYMDFALIIRKHSQEIFEKESLIRNWFTGYLFLLNLKINNGTHNISLNFNEELKNIINKFNGTNKKDLNSDDDELLELNDGGNESCFVKIHFYENGEIKEIFHPIDFNIENMGYINTMTKLIIPKLSKHLYSANVTQKIDLLNKYMENPDEVGDEEDTSIFSSYEIDQNNYIGNPNSQKIISDLNDDYFDENENENFVLNSSIFDSPKLHLKGIEENDSFSSITDFEMENLQGAQAKLEGSLLKRMKNFFIDEKGMLRNTLESENITISQPSQESLNTLTEEEEKLKSEIYNDNNEIPRIDEKYVADKNMSFDLSNMKCVNYNNLSLYENFIKNCPKIFSNILILFHILNIIS